MDGLSRRGFLKTRVARRILLAFTACALLPIAVLAFLTHRHAARNLRFQAEARLGQETKTAGMAMVQRLLLLDAELSVIAPAMAQNGARGSRANERFDRIRIVPIDGLAAEGQPAEVLARLRTGEPALLRRPDRGTPIRLARLAGTGGGTQVAVGDVARSFLAHATDYAAPGGAMCILDGWRAPLACPEELVDVVLATLPPGAGRGRGTFELRTEAGDHLAAAWPIFLAPSLGGPTWTAVAVEPYGSIYEPVREFQTVFLLTFAFALGGVVLLSHIQIRRSLEPVAILRAATTRLAARDFDTRVSITSGDEFEELGKAFDAMAGSLAAQFRAQAARAEVDRAVLSSLDETDIIDTVLSLSGSVIRCSALAVVRLNGSTAVAEVSPGAGGPIEWAVRDAALAQLDRAGRLLDGGIAPEPGGLVPPGFGSAFGPCLAAPMRNGGRLSGWVLVARDVSGPLEEDEADRIRGVADQVAVALANAGLVKDLDALRWGALHALARAVDAKSAWTAGHSERVTDVAVALGTHLGLPAADIDRLRRGGLVHDVGKIGVSAHILDKAGSLSDDEAAEMRAHPEIGARILEPIARFNDVIPIVLHHHEKFDGTGYPHRLAGDAIPYLARVVAVADVYDALTSERPYRTGLHRDTALAIIRDDAGSHFDPAIVEAFLAIMAHDDVAAPSVAAGGTFA